MRILHTSDWHLGRTFHGHPTLEAITQVLAGLTDLVREHAVDVVVVAGDVFDIANPAGPVVELLDDVLADLHAVGARVVMTSGNHDSAARLGARARFTAAAGVHVITRPELIDRPITIDDEHGPVHFYGIPFLEPAIMRSIWADAPMRSQHHVIERAMSLINADRAERGGRSVVLAHTFVVGADAESCDSERDIVVGTLDLVPKSVFAGIDYVALGHIHGRSTLADHVRYCGAPLHYSFSEAGKPRGAWLVDLDAGGLTAATWLDLPVPRPLATIRGPLDELLASEAFDAHEDHWVHAVATDQARPRDAMKRLRVRFPYCALFEHRPEVVVESSTATYGERVRNKTDREVIDAFLTEVRNGVGPNEAESALLTEVEETLRAREATA